MRLRRLAAAVTAAAAASAGLLVSSSPPAVAVPALPAGFVLTESATGLAATDAITDFAYLPDGSVLSIGKAGKVAWAAADGSTRRIIATLPVYGPQDLGLVGLALAHDYAVSRRIYLAATYAVADSYVLRLAEWTVGGSPDPVRLGSPRTIIELPGRYRLHGMTGVVASNDGTLWVTIGDLIEPFIIDPTNSRPLDPNVPEGKLLHITPGGRGVPGNPFYDAANPASWRSRVYALGFRSPFRLALDPRNGAPILGDVGQNTYEEVDYIRPGASYGWPCWEANAPTPGYRDLPFCAGPTPNTAPVWAYGRAAGGSSVTGGTFYTGDRYPAAYRGAYFFGDYTGQRIWSMQIDTQGRLTRAPEPSGFGTSIGRPVSFASGPNGDIVFADIGTGRLNRLTYVPGNRPPSAVATTDTDPATRTVSFDGGRSYDPDGDALTYSWNFGDGTTGSGASVSHTYPPEVETTTAQLTVRDPAGATATTDIAVAPSNYPPRLELTAPGPEQRFAVGDTVQASATATDVEDGPLAVSWATKLVHCSGSVCHDHPGQVSQGATYSEPFSNHDDDTRMVVTATAVDGRGVVAAQTFEAVPRLRTLALTSNVPATMVIGAQQRSSASVIVNATISFGASTTASDGVATFDRWSDAGPQQRAGFTMPDADVALTASFLTPIDRRFAADPALRNVVGPAVGGEQGTSTLRWRDHAYGARLYWTPAAGVHEVHGAINLNFRAHGGHAVFGVPSTDELPTADRVGRYNHFTGGPGTGVVSIYWTPSTGAHAVYGAIRTVWARYGYEQGLGYPLTDELSTPDRVGRFNHFSRGGSIYWTPWTGAHEVHGAIRVVWERTGWEYGLGYPLTDETRTPDGAGRYNHFSKGGSIYWSPWTGAHEVYGAIKARWAALGWERSYLGYPTSGEFSVPGGRRSNFQSGYIFWNATTGQVTDRRY